MGQRKHKRFQRSKNHASDRSRHKRVIMALRESGQVTGPAATILIASFRLEDA